MVEQIIGWANRPFPQNFIIRKPLSGSVIGGVICLIFMWLYRPLEIYQGYFSYGVTIALYSAVVAGCVFVTVHLLRYINWFRDSVRWSLTKELAAIVVIMAIAGVAIYFTGFIVEGTAGRWNFRTFFDSVMKTFLVGSIPFFFFTALNIYTRLWPALSPPEADGNKQPPHDAPIELDTPLKNEELRFHPDEFIYAFSEGNYVIFYLNRGDTLHKKIVRCTISSVEEQLEKYPFLFRSHRAYIVNLHKVEHVSGNSLGYQLQLPIVNEEIPVARSRISAFKKVYRKLA